MFNIGAGELILIFGAIFLLFGPESLPQIARKIGEILAQFKKSIDDLKNDVSPKS
jgi:TatA/E family protein of Tat protein translocase